MTQTAPPALPSPPARPPFLDAFCRILMDLRVCVAERSASGMNVGRPWALTLALVLQIDGRLNRLCHAFVVLAEKALAGTLQPSRARPSSAQMDRRAAPEHAAGAAAAKSRAVDRLPWRAGWLLGLCPPIMEQWGRQTVLSCGERFRKLIEQDEALRTLMHMMTTVPLPDCLRLPLSPSQARRQPRETRAARRSRKLVEAYWRLQADAEASPAASAPEAPPARTPPTQAPPTQANSTQAHSTQAPPYGTMTDWTPTHLTRAPRPAVGNRLVSGPPYVFRSLW